MTCQEARDRAPLYLSAEMSAAERERFAAHLAACPACRQEIEAQAQVDSRIAAALGGELPDATRIERRVRHEISSAASRRRWGTGAIAACLLLTAAGLYGLLRQPAPAGFVDAARDHRVEVMEGQPRRWRRDAAEIGEVSAQGGLSYAQAAALAAPGYTLERAKICGLHGERMLHLVFSDGTRRYSLYVGPHQGVKAPVRSVRSGSEQVAGFDTGRLRAMVVTAGSAAECDQFVRVAAARL